MLSKKQKEWWLGGFLPSDIAGLTLFATNPNLASNIIEDGSNNVSQWTDLSGNDNHLVQATGADQPDRAGNIITTDGSSDFMSAGQVISTGVSKCSFHVRVGTASTFIFGQTRDPAKRLGLLYDGANFFALAEEGGGGFNQYTIDVTDGVLRQYSFVYDASEASNPDKVKLYIDGVLISPTSTTGLFPATWEGSGNKDFEFGIQQFVFRAGDHNLICAYDDVALTQNNIDSLVIYGNTLN